MIEKQIFSIKDIEENNYTIIDNNVYDFKKLEEIYAGGKEVLINFRTKDATEKFYSVEKHGPNVKDALEKYYLGELGLKSKENQI